jgi:hypothetical protein
MRNEKTVCQEFGFFESMKQLFHISLPLHHNFEKTKFSKNGNHKCSMKLDFLFAQQKP